jgi:hypothetical protein
MSLLYGTGRHTSSLIVFSDVIDKNETIRLTPGAWDALTDSEDLPGQKIAIAVESLRGSHSSGNGFNLLSYPIEWAILESSVSDALFLASAL